MKAMTGVRLNRFLASSAIALLLCTGGTAFAGSAGGRDTSAATETTSSVSDQPAAASDIVTDPATEVAPGSAAESMPVEPSPADAAETADQPATAKPGAASGGDEVP